jgi:uncharacterized protein DUF6916
MLDSVTKEIFAPLVGSTFQIRLNPQETVPVELAEISEFPDYEGPRRAPFSLVFRGAHRFVLPQRIYQLEHEKIGPMEMFLVPIGPDQKGMRYEAVFN